MSRGNSETKFSLSGGVGRILLNRPQVHNALSPNQFTQLDKQLAEWAISDVVHAVVIEGAGGKAFCAGGDVKAVWDAHRLGDGRFNQSIFRREYSLDRRIHHYPKPYIAIIDGIVMGGGAGVSINGKFRVATERTTFAMPETAIGFFPDVGATHFLSRCPGRIGEYLGLTGKRLGPGDCLWAGIATHFVPSGKVPALIVALERAATAEDPADNVGRILAEFHQNPPRSSLSENAQAINHCFGQATLRETISALVADGSEWAWDALEAIGENSPTAQAVTFLQLKDGRNLSFDEAICREFRMACRMLKGHDFFEGIRAMVIDKDRMPYWQPQTIADVTDAEVMTHFVGLGADELDFCNGLDGGNKEPAWEIRTGR